MEYFQQLKTIFSGYGTPLINSENVSQRYHSPPQRWKPVFVQ
ncbi:hypothetical protein T12_15547 [Trichinella patagoniensis]|uniref:Uncharacterized protein n=1 Tax=Trichinella patagoniensis TaxID=990121 RepID=A0A0V0XPJ8_9BILA|nr:hypothetical protein T12_15547 [Trichinella patagoniensis]